MILRKGISFPFIYLWLKLLVQPAAWECLHLQYSFLKSESKLKLRSVSEERFQTIQRSTHNMDLAIQWQVTSCSQPCPQYPLKPTVRYTVYKLLHRSSLQSTGKNIVRITSRTAGLRQLMDSPDHFLLDIICHIYYIVNSYKRSHGT